MLALIAKRHRVGAPATDPHWANVVSLLQFPGADGSSTIVDSAISRTWAPHDANAHVSAGTGPFGQNSLRVDNSSLDTATTSDFAFGTADYTVEGFFKIDSLSDSPVLFDFRPSANGAYPEVGTDSAGNIGFFYLNAVQIVSPSPIIVTGVYRHIALCRASGQTRMFYNGTQVGSTYADTGNVPSCRIRLGANGFSYQAPLTGNVAEFRVTKGFGRYTANFTPPTAPFPTS